MCRLSVIILGAAAPFDPELSLLGSLPSLPLQGSIHAARGQSLLAAGLIGGYVRPIVARLFTGNRSSEIVVGTAISLTYPMRLCANSASSALNVPLHCPCIRHEQCRATAAKAERSGNGSSYGPGGPPALTHLIRRGYADLLRLGRPSSQRQGGTACAVVARDAERATPVPPMERRRTHARHSRGLALRRCLRRCL
jgi:hypothetical protein